MLKTLIKKQLSELRSYFFFNKKKGEKYTGGKLVGMIILFAFIAFSCAFAFYGMGMGFAAATIPLGFDWLYFTIMGGVCFIVGVIGNSFTTFNILYKGKDNEILLSLPIKPGYILISRMLSVYIMGAIYTFIVWLPMLICYFVNAGFSTSVLAGSTICLIMLTLFVFIVSCILGFIIAEISTRIKSKAVISVILILLIIGIYYLMYFRFNAMLQSFMQNAQKIESAINGLYNPLYMLGNAFLGALHYLLITFVSSIVLTGITYLVLDKTFIRVSTRSQKVSKKEYKADRQIKTSSIKSALLSREQKKFFGIPVYMINSGLGVVVIIIGAIAIAIKGSDLASLKDALVMFSKFYGELIYILVVAALIMVISMNNVSLPSLPLEGKTLWILKSLPVETKDILEAKVNLHVKINSIPPVIFSVVFGIVLGASVDIIILMSLASYMYVWVTAYAGVLLSLRNPNFDWPNETVPVKQDLKVLIIMLSGWGIGGAIAGGYFLVYKVMNFTQVGAFQYIMFWFVAFVIASTILRKKLYTEGVKKFEAL